MREYEAVYIIKPNFEDEKYPEIIEKYTALIQNNGGEIVSVEPWGKKRLAYEIEKLREGYYVLTRFNAGLGTHPRSWNGTLRSRTRSCVI